MIMNIVGTVFETDKREIKDKKTGEISYKAVVTVQQIYKDAKGKRLLRAEDYLLDVSHLPELERSIDKYIVLYVQHISWGANDKRQAGSMVMPMDTLEFQIFDKNPFDKSEVKKAS